MRDFGIEQNYRLKIVDASFDNAFAYPKNTIIFTKSLLEKLDDDEFKAILGHEVGHHYYEHYKPAIIRAFILSFFMGASQTPTVITSFLSTFFSSKHSRDAERESDRHSTELMRAAGLDLSSNITAMRKISAGVKESKYLSIMSTHPLTEKRIEYFNSQKDYKGEYSQSRDLILSLSLIHI